MKYIGTIEVEAEPMTLGAFKEAFPQFEDMPGEPDEAGYKATYLGPQEKFKGDVNWINKTDFDEVYKEKAE